jgi:hypothetical protein
MSDYPRCAIVQTRLVFQPHEAECLRLPLLPRPKPSKASRGSRQRRQKVRLEANCERERIEMKHSKKKWTGSECLGRDGEGSPRVRNDATRALRAS